MRLVHPTHSVLEAKNFPAAIEDTGGEELPESIREKAKSVQSQVGSKHLKRSSTTSLNSCRETGRF